MGTRVPHVRIVEPKKDFNKAETRIGQWFEAKNKAVKKKKYDKKVMWKKLP